MFIRKENEMILIATALWIYVISKYSKQPLQMGGLVWYAAAMLDTALFAYLISKL